MNAFSGFTQRVAYVFTLENTDYPQHYTHWQIKLMIDIKALTLDPVIHLDAP